MSDFQCLVGVLFVVWVVGLFAIAASSGKPPKNEE